jgi:5-methylcytosine-specific restriction protein A
MPHIPRKSKRKNYLPSKKPFRGKAATNMGFYNSKKWRNLRLVKLRLNPLCEHCLKKDIITEAKIVDHIIEINDGGAKLSIDNLQSLCSPCHNSKSGKRGAKERNKI